MQWCSFVGVASSAWVFTNDNGDPSNCANNCANNAQNNSDFRSALFAAL
ncbi:MAG: hypothetical protein FWG80_04975 [Alphaproteobacteria bacterium]|nr:hypothetical protein [Alphaproteobacteria bacterium]